MKLNQKTLVTYLVYRSGGRQIGPFIQIVEYNKPITGKDDLDAIADMLAGDYEHSTIQVIGWTRFELETDEIVK